MPDMIPKVMRERREDRELRREFVEMIKGGGGEYSDFEVSCGEGGSAEERGSEETLRSLLVFFRVIRFRV